MKRDTKSIAIAAIYILFSFNLDLWQLTNDSFLPYTIASCPVKRTAVIALPATQVPHQIAGLDTIL
jgi:DNA polymerase IIIc chi subunit